MKFTSPKDEEILLQLSHNSEKYPNNNYYYDEKLEIKIKTIVFTPKLANFLIFLLQSLACRKLNVFEK
jgi:hypothetical protein